LIAAIVWYSKLSIYSGFDINTDVLFKISNNHFILYQCWIKISNILCILKQHMSVEQYAGLFSVLVPVITHEEMLGVILVLLKFAIWLN
jgi:hypothetical protein